MQDIGPTYTITVQMKNDWDLREDIVCDVDKSRLFSLILSPLTTADVPTNDKTTIVLNYKSIQDTTALHCVSARIVPTLLL